MPGSGHRLPGSRVLRQALQPLRPVGGIQTGSQSRFDPVPSAEAQNRANTYTRRHNYLRISPPLGRAALLRRLDQGEAAASPYQKDAQ